MDLTLSDDQVTLRDLARDVFARQAPTPRVEKVETTEERFDRDLWRELATTGLLGAAVPDTHGGLGFGMVELALVCEQLGRAVAPVPLVATTCAAALIAAHGSTEQQSRLLAPVATGDAVIAVAPPPCAAGVRADGDRLTGRLVGVPWAHVADVVVVPVGERVYLLDPATVGAERGTTTAREVALDLVLDDTAVEPVGGAGAAGLLLERWRVGLAATQAGVTDAALRMTADYTSARHQFGKPLSTFQGVALKAADAYVDTVVIGAEVLQAAWTIDAGLDPTLAVLSAAWWAAEAGQHCVHVTQHLHGGMGADVTYPVHRYFLWAKQIELMLGGASALLAELGDALAARTDAGDALAL